MDRRRALAQLAACGAMVASRGGRAQAEQASVEMQWRHTGDIGALALVDGTLQGRPWRALLDTGASSAVVPPALARELMLERIDRVRVATLGGVQQVDRVRLAALKLGAYDAPAASALVLDLAALLGPALGGVDGLIGMPALRGSVCLFDFARRRLQLTPEAVPAMRDMTPGALSFESGLPVIELRLGGRAPARFLFDTGNAGALVVFEHHARTLLAAAPSLPSMRLHELGGTVDAHYALIERIEGPGFVARDVPVAFEVGARARRGGHFDRVAGSAGTALFRAARVALDSREPSNWRIEPETLPPLPGGFGLVLDGERPPRVAAVLEGGPAARAGLRPSYRLVTLQGRPARQLAAHEVWQALDGLDEAACDWLLPDGALLHTTLLRARFFPRLA